MVFVVTSNTPAGGSAIKIVDPIRVEYYKSCGWDTIECASIEEASEYVRMYKASIKEKQTNVMSREVEAVAVVEVVAPEPPKEPPAVGSTPPPKRRRR